MGNPRVSATWEFQGSVCASELESFCREYEVAFGDFVQISPGDCDLRFFGHLFGEYVDQIQQLDSISNLTCDFTIGFENSVVFHGVVEWKLYGIVRGFVDRQGGSWHDISKEELEELEVEGLLERRGSK